MTNKVVTRFPPSPTGYMHIGTARTALFNWIYARKNGGKMLFRIEDTDRKRHNEDAVQNLIEGLEWLGIDWDGEIVSQYEQRARHAEIAKTLLDKGAAYKCYCTPDELEHMRETAKKEGRITFYDRRWRDKDDSDAPQDRNYVIRIKAPLEGQSTLHDKVQGKVTLNNEQLDDFIILRSDGSPTYMLSVVVDDYDMGVTHVIRGDDHLNNTFRQNIIYEAMNWDKPEYAHLPLILGPDGTKMSKRHGAASVEEYRKMGYLPAALRNYLLRLGWSHGDDEIISDAQALEWFDLSGCNKAAARFDFDKLESLNPHYIKQTDNAELLERCLPLYEERLNKPLDEASKMMILQSMDELKSRAKTLLQIIEESLFYADKNITPDEKAGDIIGSDDAQQVLAEIPDRLEKIQNWNAENIMQASKDYAKEKLDGKLGKVGMPLRAKITGRTASPGIFHVMEILGQKDTLERLRR
ncbi:MAG: glutamate--tRNA ligase [Alphaproteobacteria bacterium]